MTLKLPTWDELMVIYPKSIPRFIKDTGSTSIWYWEEEQNMAEDRILNLFPHPTASTKLVYKTTHGAEGCILKSMYGYLMELEGRTFGTSRHLGRPTNPKPF